MKSAFSVGCGVFLGFLMIVAFVCFLPFLPVALQGFKEGFNRGVHGDATATPTPSPIPLEVL